MKNIRKLVGMLAVAALTAAATSAQAALITYNNRTAFEALGTVSVDGFEDIDTSSGFANQTNPNWPRNGVTYTTGDNVVIGPSLGYGNTDNIFTYNGFSAVSGDVTVLGTTLFGFDLGSIDQDNSGNAQPQDITIYTSMNGSGYIYNIASVTHWKNGSEFFGYQATGVGEVITGFLIVTAGCTATLDEYGNPIPCQAGAAIDNVTLGYSTPTGVPEPGALALLALGLGLIGFRRRRA